MPKEPKKKLSSHATGASTRHAPLGQVIQDDVNRGKYATRKVGSGKRDARGSDDDEEIEEVMLDEKTTRKILDLSRDQQREMMMLEEQEELSGRRRSADRGDKKDKEVKTKKNTTTRRSREDSSDEEESDHDEEEEEEEEEELMVSHDRGYVSVSPEGIGLTPEEEALLSDMMGGGGGGDGDDDEEMPVRTNLADIVMAKIEEKEAMARAAASGHHVERGDEEGGETGMDLPPKVVQVYTDIGKLLTHYTSGKLPKAFKVIPSLHNWEEVLYLTRPDLWTPQAMYAATRIFASNLNPKMAQRFYNLVLLDAVRADIYSNKKLNHHYYEALKKSVYKPAAFFKGILLPLCGAGSSGGEGRGGGGCCTLREAIIVASVLQRVSIPVHHAAVALHKLATTTRGYDGATCIFIKTLLNKKYSLPAPVITTLVDHFAKFGEKKKEDSGEGGMGREEEELPVLWHQALLTFAQRYGSQVGPGGKERLRVLMKVHFHPKITPEVRRELFGAAAWREERGGEGVGGDNAMAIS